jgi:hypothetical protein
LGEVSLLVPGVRGRLTVAHGHNQIAPPARDSFSSDYYRGRV